MGRTSTSKARLLQAGRDLVWKQSYGAVTIDAICLEANVRKGSFYYFFDSKPDLIMASFIELWKSRKEKLDETFSPLTPPLERLRNHFQQAYARQVELKAKYGHVVGCAFSCLGSELCEQEEPLRAKAREILAEYHRYIETALREAKEQGAAELPHLAATQRQLIAYIHGCLLQARVDNDVELLAGLWQGAADIIGVNPDSVPLTAQTTPAAATAAGTVHHAETAAASN